MSDPIQGSAPKKPRVAVIDSLRGCLLILMALDHLGGFWSQTFYERFGFFSAAEGFFFLSGLVATQVALRKESPGTWFRKRALTIQSWHLLSVFAVGFIAVLLSPYGWSMLPGFGVVAENPSGTLLAVVLLQHLPDYLDVLPLYVFLMLFASFVIPTLLKHIPSPRKAALCLWSGSTFLWLAAQVDLWGTWRELLPVWMQAGAFDPFAWQWIFFTGSAIAFAPPDIRTWPRKWLGVVVAGAVLGFLWKNGSLGLSIPDRAYFWASRNHLGPLRIASFACFASLVAYIATHYPQALTFRFPNLLGRHSLQVFVWHLPWVYLWLFRPAQLGSVAGILLPFLVILSMGVPAIIREKT